MPFKAVIYVHTIIVVCTCVLYNFGLVKSVLEIRKKTFDHFIFCKLNQRNIFLNIEPNLANL